MCGKHLKRFYNDSVHPTMSTDRHVFYILLTRPFFLFSSSSPFHCFDLVREEVCRGEPAGPLDGWLALRARLVRPRFVRGVRRHFLGRPKRRRNHSLRGVNGRGRGRY